MFTTAEFLPTGNLTPCPFFGILTEFFQKPFAFNYHVLEVQLLMNSKVKKTLVWGVVGAVFYFLLSFHIIFVGSKVKLLKKSSLTLEYTIFSTQGKSNESILRVDDLRRDGIGELLVSMGRLSEEELDLLLQKLEE
jgi:hypothetical protein